LRIDLFLKVVGLAKTRMGAKRLCEIQKILVNGHPVKPSHEILAGDALAISLPAKDLRLKVLKVPFGKSVSKKERVEFIEFLGESGADPGLI